MKNAIIAVFAVLMLITLLHIAAAEDIVFAVDALYKDGKISVQNIDLAEGKAPDYLLQPEDGNIASVVGFNGKELFTFNFSTSLYAYDSNKSLDERPLLLIFPYYGSVKELNLYSPEKQLMLKVDLSDYATCNQNKVCNPEIGEDEKLCAEDCTRTTTKDKKEETVSGEKAEAEAEKPAGMPWLALIAAAAAVTAVLFVYMKIKRRQND